FLGQWWPRATFPELVIVSLFAGIGEELLFRGFLQSWLGGYGLLVALVVPNVLFGVLHWISRGYAVCTFCIGLYFSCLLHFVDSVNLPALMIAHSLYDLVALLCLTREIRSRDAAVC
ncbi:MAG: CPBP family intramembrane glutamic endopeptidase, partial [Planctomycetales bacterium]